MNLIELAAQRLNQLARTGVLVDQLDGNPASHRAPPSGEHRFARPVRPPVVDGTPTSPPCPVSDALASLRERGLAIDPAVRTTLSEEFRHIKLAVIQRIQPDQPNTSLVMVTSSTPGEGKTFCAINLALSLAMEVDRRVLLVDGDVVRGKVSSTLGIPPRDGLLELLADPRLRLSDVVLPTDVPQLSILPPGHPTPRSAELLGSPAMVRLLDEIRDRDPGAVVVFDSTPMLLTTEAKLLAHHVGQVLVVVEAFRTTEDMVLRTLEALEQHPGLMTVLNRADPADFDYVSYYA